MTATTTPHRCHHCAREVEETKHTRTSYRVGGYEIHGGDVEEVTKPRSEDDPELVTILRVIEPHDACTCAACYHLPAVAAERELLFRPELRESSV
jgi:hypothetical protein